MFRRMKLSEIGQIVAGGTPKTKIEEYWNGDVPWITPKDLSSHAGMYISRGERNISQVGLDNSSAKLLPKGTVLFTSRAPIGYVAIARNEVTTNQGFKSIIVDDEHDNIFTYYLLKNNIDIIENHANGSTFKEISGSVMKSLEFGIPSLREQKAIAHILSTLDDKIEINNQINKTLENMAQAIFKQWFVDFEFPNEDGEPYKSSGGEMVESELGMIPKGWEVKTILEMDLIVTDYVANGSFKALKENVTLYEEYNYAIFMRNTDLKCNFNSGMKYVDQHSYDFLKKSQLFGGEVIISNVGDVGSVYLCPYFDQPMTLGNNVIMVKAETNQIWNHFVYRLFNSREGQGMIDSITGGSAQPKFNKTDFRNLKVVIPSEMFISNYMKTLSSIEDCILLNDKQNSELIKLRDSLLPKLMSGEIRVPLDEEGEAS